MVPRDDAEVRRALEGLRERLDDQIAGSRGRAGTVELDQAAMGRVSRGDALQQQQMAAAERRRAEVRRLQVDRALEALEDGEYGACTRCGEDIPEARLLARPETPFCVACAHALGA